MATGGRKKDCPTAVNDNPHSGCTLVYWVRLQATPFNSLVLTIMIS